MAQLKRIILRGSNVDSESACPHAFPELRRVLLGKVVFLVGEEQ